MALETAGVCDLEKMLTGGAPVIVQKTPSTQSRREAKAQRIFVVEEIGA
jgi:hypothetical protein